MKRRPRHLGGTGYFDSLSSESLAKATKSLASIKDDLHAYFTIPEDDRRHLAKYGFHVICEMETLESENDEPDVLQEFAQVLCSMKWQTASVSVTHGALYGDLNLRYIGAVNNEEIDLTFDSETGACEMRGLLRDVDTTRAFLTQIWEDLNLSDKPKKASRYITPELEIKLLCDSMHLCSVCREPG
jgi:hypothetical protein